MGCRTEPAAVHIAHVLQRLHFFQFFNFFFSIYTTYRKNKIHSLTAKIKNSFFLIIHTTYSKKKLHAFTAKKITRLDGFFVRLTFFTLLPKWTLAQTHTCPARSSGIR